MFTMHGSFSSNSTNSCATFRDQLGASRTTGTSAGTASPQEAHAADDDDDVEASGGRGGSGGGGGGNRANGVGLNRGNPADVAKVDVVPMGPDAVAAPTAVCASAPKRALADCRKPVPSSACPGASEGEAPNAAPAPAAAEEEDTAAPPRPSSGLSKCSERPRYSTRFWKCSSRSAGSASGGGHAPDPPSNRRSRRARSTRRKETGSKSRK
mmetsp:Transcript_79805/g.215795  ORF Transcript_79805/g.215795 Transcript_79805/m.215795 type:complete len:211 (+) Transcript_79805:386-1018(+)